MDNARGEINWAAVGRWAGRNEEPHLVRLLQEVALSVRLPDDEPLERLGSLGSLKEVLEQVVRIEVQEMRRWYDTSWVDIAEALGMSRQGARQKFQHPADEELAAYEELRDIELAALKADVDVALAKIRLEGVKQGWTSAELEKRTREVRDSFKPRAAKFIEDHMDRYPEVVLRTERAYGTKKKG